MPTAHDNAAEAADSTSAARHAEALLKAGALERAIFSSANVSCMATDANGVIQIFNAGAERMPGYAAAEVMNTITPADISDPQEVIARATALSVELDTAILPGSDALVFKASRGIEDIYELTYIRKDGSRFPAVVSVAALRDEEDGIIGCLLIVLDLMMPDVSGFEVVAALNETADTARIPILVVTAKEIAAEDRAKLSRHATTIVDKAGFKPDRFTGEVRRAMAGRSGIR